MSFSLLRLLAFGAFMTGCGANVVFAEDGPAPSDGGSGGADGGNGNNGGFSQTDGGGGQTVHTTPVTCESLYSQFANAFAQATACNVCADFDPCITGKVIFDECGCVASTSDPDLAQQASQAYDAWVSNGCGPFACETCVGGTSGCMPTDKSCIGSCQ